MTAMWIRKETRPRHRPTAEGGGLLVGLLAILAGCTAEPDFRLNAVHQRTIEKEQLDGEAIAGERINEVGDILTALFGTPADPVFPDIPGLDPVVDPGNLQWAAGPVASDRRGLHSGLYREHCAHCHGVSGDGAGPTAAALNPYPRDFRLGKFKFKSTRMYRPPTDSDLRRILEDGIPGTGMPSFRLLDEAEQDALVDYVKYLSIRGMVERALLEETARLDPDEPLLSPRAEDPEGFDDRLGLVMDEVVIPVLEKWNDRERNVTDVPSLPEDFFETRKVLGTNGRALFFGKANCGQCHGPTGLGDGQTRNFDEWTNEWLKRAKVDENNPLEIAEFVELGALPPRRLRPRNLAHKVFRGGGTPTDLYRRIADGIEGSSMPAASGLNSEEVWALVAYVLEIGFLDMEGHEGHDH